MSMAIPGACMCGAVRVEAHELLENKVKFQTLFEQTTALLETRDEALPRHVLAKARTCDRRPAPGGWRLARLAAGAPSLHQGMTR